MRQLFTREKGLLAVFCACIPIPSFAYIDPGTGSALFYLVSGLVVSAYFALRGLYYQLMNALFQLRFHYQHCGIAIHSEDPRYESTFIPIIEQLSKNGEIDVTFFTMYERDESLPSLPPNVAHKSIPSGLIGYAYLNSLQATVLATTTPQLDIMTFRRSRKVNHYCMVPHALGESRYVRPFAYDYFDSVLCCGPTLMKNIRKLEQIRRLPKKLLLKTGIPHYEVLMRLSKDSPGPDRDQTVLIAPSWGPLSMFESHGTEFVREIAQFYKVIVRPHPQMRVSQQELYEEILGLEGVEVDISLTPANAMSRAHLLLSDISGIAHEFAFIYERPVLILDRKNVEGGLEGELLGGQSELQESCKDFIVPVLPSEVHDLTSYIEASLVKGTSCQIRARRSQLIYNFESGARVAATQLTDIYMAEISEKDASQGKYLKRLTSKFAS